MVSSSFGASRQRSDSAQRSQSSSDVWGAQAPFLQNLYMQAQGLAGNQMGNVGARSTELSNEVLDAYRDSSGTFSTFAGGNDPMQRALATRVEAGNPYLERIISSVGEDINRNLGVQLNQLDQSAGLEGVRGGARNLIARGEAVTGANREFGRAASDIRYGDYTQGNQILQNLTQQRLQALEAGRAGAADIYNIGMQPYQAQWGPLSQLAAIIGGPTLLQESSSSGESMGRGWSTNSAFSFGGGS